ncbi:hypothetical protein Save01_06497 [Streptomyces avermitilis]|uniref:Uncharacterized protein n=1 Tax=Streptomyces avermitilis (strain ATCC 31267 / DSM 46492 / JCM 5070 / NBRC 14893 / NCIMB 12804 / NRRL 8165 / MA-4680) TaxID=227882 RepID=Q82Y97_STRAW|nr:conserved hypothetical protein [Streptomyces avermitilis MA-4680 = NBRC 14893]
MIANSRNNDSHGTAPGRAHLTIPAQVAPSTGCRRVEVPGFPCNRAAHPRQWKQDTPGVGLPSGRACSRAENNGERASGSRLAAVGGQARAETVRQDSRTVTRGTDTPPDTGATTAKSGISTGPNVIGSSSVRCCPSRSHGGVRDAVWRGGGGTRGGGHGAVCRTARPGGRCWRSWRSRGWIRGPGPMCVTRAPWRRSGRRSDGVAGSSTCRTPVRSRSVTSVGRADHLPFRSAGNELRQQADPLPSTPAEFLGPVPELALEDQVVAAATVWRTRSARSEVEPGRWVHNQTSKPRKHRGAGRPGSRVSTTATSLRKVTSEVPNIKVRCGCPRPQQGVLSTPHQGVPDGIAVRFV